MGNGANVSILPGMMQRFNQDMYDHVRARRQGTASTTRPQLDNNEECLLYTVILCLFSRVRLTLQPALAVSLLVGHA